jgi:NAD(P) transhydrogenase subunit beta
VAQASKVFELAQCSRRRGRRQVAIHRRGDAGPHERPAAEANVPYTQLFDLDQINTEFERCDAVLVVGANDVVNPAARNDPQSPLWGMPILDVDKAQNIIVMKRSMNPGFAGVENELFYDRKTAMLFGNAKDSLQKLITEVKAL